MAGLQIADDEAAGVDLRDRRRDRAHEREATLRLASDDATRAQFPWDFVVELRYALAGSTLTVDARIENPGPEPLPFALGYHPYFYVPDADKPHAMSTTNSNRRIAH